MHILGYPNVWDISVVDRDNPSQKWDCILALGLSQGNRISRWNLVTLASPKAKVQSRDQVGLSNFSARSLGISILGDEGWKSLYAGLCFTTIQGKTNGQAF